MQNPMATFAFVDLLSGQTTYLRVIARLLGGLPLFLLTESTGRLAGLAGGSAGKERLLMATYRNYQCTKLSSGKFAGD